MEEEVPEDESMSSIPEDELALSVQDQFTPSSLN